MHRLVLALAVILGSARLFAESRPPVDQVARRDVLIVKCVTEIEDGFVNYRVLETWKGAYQTTRFTVEPKEGYLYARGFALDAMRSAKDGQEIIFFYSDNAVARDPENRGKLLAHRADCALAVVDGKVTWSPGEPEPTVYTLDDLKAAVLAALKDPGQNRP
jgi:hypothetical protein